MTPAALAADLRRIVRGTVTDAGEALEARSSDYGRVVRRRAAVIVRPTDAGDVAGVVRFAARHGVAVTTQAAGHTQAGQSLSDGGVLLDMHGFGAVEEVDPARALATVGAGVVWRDLVDRTLGHGLVPPVLTNNLFTTVGGTTAVGGVGYSSFRHGVQLDNHTALEVVTGTGDVVWCSAEENPDLFLHALGGLGQFGVVTRLRHRLRRAGTEVFSSTLVYGDPQELLDDARLLAGAGAAEHLRGWAAHRGGRWIFALSLDCEDASAPLPHGLRFVRRGGERRQPYRDFVLANSTLGRPGWSRDRATVAPGVDVILPREAGGAFIAEVLEWFPPALRAASTILMLLLDRASLTRPMFVTPDAESLVLFTIEPEAGAAESDAVIGLLERIDARGRELGGKRYVPGWLRYGPREWREHFGSRWPQVVRMKERFDPARVLVSGGVHFADGG